MAEYWDLYDGAGQKTGKIHLRGIKVPEGLQLSRIDAGSSYVRPGAQQQKQGKWQKGNQKSRKHNK